MKDSPVEVEYLGTTYKFRRRNKFSPFLFTFPIKREIRNFYVVVVQKWQKKIQKKLRCTGKVVTLLSSRLKSLMFPAKQEEVMSFDEGITFLRMLDGKASGLSAVVSLSP